MVSDLVLGRMSRVRRPNPLTGPSKCLDIYPLLVLCKQGFMGFSFATVAVLTAFTVLASLRTLTRLRVGCVLQRCIERKRVRQWFDGRDAREPTAFPWWYCVFVSGTGALLNEVECIGAGEIERRGAFFQGFVQPSLPALLEADSWMCWCMAACLALHRYT